jgi:type IV pilus assembly protein PilV
VHAEPTFKEIQMKPISMPNDQAGIMLLESLIAILIFSFGILAVVGMQANAVQDMSQAKYRSDAAFLANQLIADIWTNAKNADTYEWTSTGNNAAPASITDWIGRVNDTLPGAEDNPPSIEYDDASKELTVVVRWVTPSEHSANPSAPPHQFTAVTYINTNPS